MRDNTHDNDGNTCKNDDNTLDKQCQLKLNGNGGNTRTNDDNVLDKPYQLKLNDIDCYFNCHVGFGAQVGI